MKSVADLLRDDHRKVQDLFKQFEKADDSETKQSIVQQALKELTIHATVEEEIIYPALEEVIEEREMVEEALQEHHVAKILIAELWKMTPDSEHYNAKFTVLAEAVKHHIKGEESELLPQLEDYDGTLAEQVLDRKEELAAKIERATTLPMGSGRTAKRTTGAAKSDGRRAPAKASTTVRVSVPPRHSGGRATPRAGSARGR